MKGFELNKKKNSLNYKEQMLIIHIQTKKNSRNMKYLNSKEIYKFCVVNIVVGNKLLWH